ncbi:MAG: 2-phosphosulfolactate phosphatase [Cyclobacteriaceae bacterium]|nr:2-phosphosulfolactate phosphatase [Cyclobacteriaceae bacterium]
MKTIDVCLSPELIHLYDVSDKTVVVVDILRATSCMVTALAHGVECIIPMASETECERMKSKGYIISGERNGQKIQGFDKGNSPFEYMEEDIRGLKIAFTTTNGTQAIEKSKGAKKILIGSFLNLSAITRYLLMSDDNILIVCAGWKGKLNLEDSLFAGALVDNLRKHIEPDCDAPMIARELYLSAKDDMMKFLSASSHVKRLNRLNIHKDIEFCLTPDLYHVIPILKRDRLVLL